MIAWFVIAIATIGLFAYIAYAGVGTTDALSDAAARTETIRRMDATAAALLRRAASPDQSGVLLLPAGAATASGYGVPSEMASMAVSSYGRPFQYCVFGAQGGSMTTSATVTSPNGTSYAIGTQDFDGRTYVVAGRPALAQVAENANLLGYLVASISPSSPNPGCDQVTYSGGRFTAPGAVVRPILRDMTADVSRNDLTGGQIFYVSTTGTGSGRTPTDPAALTTAIDAYRVGQGPSVVIRLAEGTYALPANYLNSISTSILGKASGSGLVLQGLGAGATITGLSSIDVPSDIALVKIVLPRTTTLTVESGRHALIANSQTGTIVGAVNSDILLQGTNVVTAATGSAAFDVRGGRLQATDSLTIRYASGNTALSAGEGTTVSLHDATVAISPADGAGTSVANGLYVEQGARMSVTSVTLSYQGPYASGITNNGIFMASNLAIQSNAAGNVMVNLMPGSTTTFGGTIAGSSYPAYGIYSQQGARLAGTGQIYSSNRCWADSSATAGALFAYSGNGRTGTLSGVSADEVATITAVAPLLPSAAEAKNYADTSARNAERTVLRARNTSSFTCLSSS